MRPVQLLAAPALAIMPMTATAQTGEPAQLGPALQVCRGEADDSRRLACYDQVLDRVLGVDPALVATREAYRRERFGLPVDSDGSRMTELTTTIAAVDEDIRRGTSVVTLENGQVWSLLSGGGLRASMKPGMTVSISASGIGGYRLRVPGKPGFRGVARVR
jgi:hypothetical protein